jgi:choline dehydrogenase-like flavoprotein
MIFDLNIVELTSLRERYDVCIAGGGVAGITLSIGLAARGRRVLLLEAGGLDFAEESQHVYQGEIVGRSYYSLDNSRLRFLGGTSNLWEGRCRPLDAHDFTKRDAIPYSGWPFGKNELDLYLDRSCDLLEISPLFIDHELPGSHGTLTLADFHFSRPPVRFGEKFRRELQTSERIDVFLNANLVNIVLDKARGRVSAFQCANYVDPGTVQPVVASIFVLALGGIENPRLLLSSRSQMPNGIGNGHNMVGRFFMEHIHVLGGFFVTSGATWRFSKARFSPTTKLVEDRGIANCRVGIWPSLEASRASLVGGVRRRARRFLCGDDAVADFVRNLLDFSCSYRSDIGAHVEVVCEQAPNPDSRVFLLDDSNRFGLPRVALDWQITELERRTMKETMIALGSYFASNELGNIKLVDWLLDENQPVPGVGEDPWLGAGWHHMGTTRIGATAEEGVVDGNCQVFGLDNLYIAGSSVFPTGGHANPTLTIVQLTLRLCDYLVRSLDT